MSTQKLIIYKLKSLYHILEELNLDLNFKIIFVDNENTLNNEVNNFNYYLIISNNLILNIKNQFILINTPINIFQLIENVNIEFLKIQFNCQSEIKINDYTVNLNSRELIIKALNLG